MPDNTPDANHLPNQQQGIPIIPQDISPDDIDKKPKFQSFHISGTQFLKAKQKCFPGSGQPPDACEGGDNFNKENPLEGGADYNPPLNWPLPTSLLIVPRVIWLVAYFPDAYPPTAYSSTSGNYNLILTHVVLTTGDIGAFAITEGATLNQSNFVPFVLSGQVVYAGLPVVPNYCTKPKSGNGIINAGGFSNGITSYFTVDHVNGPFVGAPNTCDSYSYTQTTKLTVIGHDNWNYEVHIPNPYIEIRNRLYNDVFPAVKEHIESHYPSTYVDIIEWHNKYPNNKETQELDPTPTIDPIEPNDPVITLNANVYPFKKYQIITNIYSPHIGPLMSDPCFGTNFLHLHIGFPINLSISDNSVPNYSRDSFNSLDLNDDPVFKFGLDQLKKYSKIMAGYTVMMWGFNPPIDTFPTAPPTPAIPFVPSGPSMTAVEFGGTQYAPTAQDVSTTPNWGPALNFDTDWSKPIKDQDKANIEAVNVINGFNTTNATDANIMIQQFVDKSNDFANAQSSDNPIPGTKQAAGIKYKYMGDNGDEVTIDQLIKIIITHYKLTQPIGNPKLKIKIDTAPILSVYTDESVPGTERKIFSAVSGA